MGLGRTRQPSTRGQWAPTAPHTAIFLLIREHHLSSTLINKIHTPHLTELTHALFRNILLPLPLLIVQGTWCSVMRREPRAMFITNVYYINYKQISQKIQASKIALDASFCNC